MLKIRTEVMRSIAKPLIESEKLVDAAIGALTTAIAASVAGRDKARLPLDAGTVGLEQAVSALQQLTAGRRALAAAHIDFADVKDRMGLSRIAASDDGYGDTGNTPREYAAIGTEPRLIVSNAA